MRRQGSPLEESPDHRRARCEHLLKGNLAVKVFWPLPLLPEQLPGFKMCLLDVELQHLHFNYHCFMCLLSESETYWWLLLP